MIEHRLLRRLKPLGISLAGLPLDDVRRFALQEASAINMGLPFRTPAPMRNLEHMLAVAVGIEAMPKEKAAYWLRMAMHRKYPGFSWPYAFC